MFLNLVGSSAVSRERDPGGWGRGREGGRERYQVGVLKDQIWKWWCLAHKMISTCLGEWNVLDFTTHKETHIGYYKSGSIESLKHVGKGNCWCRWGGVHMPVLFFLSLVVFFLESQSKLFKNHVFSGLALALLLFSFEVGHYCVFSILWLLAFKWNNLLVV